MKSIEKENKLVTLMNEDELIGKLQADAEIVDAEVSRNLHQRLMANIDKNSEAPRKNSVARWVWHKSYIALAASTVFAVLLFSINQNNSPVDSNEIVAEIDKPVHIETANASESGSDLMASNQLDAEYQAILADISKVKLELAAL